MSLPRMPHVRWVELFCILCRRACLASPTTLIPVTTSRKHHRLEEHTSSMASDESLTALKILMIGPSGAGKSARTPHISTPRVTTVLTTTPLYNSPDPILR
jgi:hypothetical protein